MSATPSVEQPQPQPKPHLKQSSPSELARRTAQLRAYQFSSVNARQMAQLAIAKRRQNRERKIALEAAQAGKPRFTETERKRWESVEERLRLLAEQIARTREVLNGDMEPRDRAQMLNALDRLLERERILMGIPGPGNLRPVAERRSSPGDMGAVGPVGSA